ncbi:MAG: guanylate kinase, partial [Proteobacteria bacterium]|nr:guanylate kinase [Pseudomonadota bacterium]
MNDGSLFIVSAPSGAGKTTLCNMAVEHFPTLEHSVSYTTRKPREGEVDGVHYNFIDDATFAEMESAGEFVENALVHGNRYGTSGSELRRLLKEGTDIMVEIDVQGAAQLRDKFSEAVFIFIVPPSVDACRERLTSRGKDTDEVILKRLAKATEEMKEARNYDYIIINDELDEAFVRFSS